MRRALALLLLVVAAAAIAYVVRWGLPFDDDRIGQDDELQAALDDLRAHHPDVGQVVVDVVDRMRREGRL
jgi:hypothetical protein